MSDDEWPEYEPWTRSEVLWMLSVIGIWLALMTAMVVASVVAF